MTQQSEMIQKQLQHRTIREFTGENIDQETMELLLEVARRTPTSSGMQASSIIRITDTVLKDRISQVCNQEFVARAPELMIFVADQYRNKQIGHEKGVATENAGSVDRFFQAFTDTCIMAQNLVNAAEAMDIGAVYLGSIHNNTAQICELLQLPQLTFPCVGLALGYPNQNPRLKPRMDNRLKVFENRYHLFPSYLREIAEYDETMKQYYGGRQSNQRIDTFSDQVITKLETVNLKRLEMLEVLRTQGFKI